MRQSRGLYMGLETSVKQFVERMNDLNCYMLYFTEGNPQAVRYPECREAIIDTIIEI
jgi:hypothetical protein